MRSNSIINKHHTVEQLASAAAQAPVVAIGNHVLVNLFLVGYSIYITNHI